MSTKALNSFDGFRAILLPEFRGNKITLRYNLLLPAFFRAAQRCFIIWDRRLRAAALMARLPRRRLGGEAIFDAVVLTRCPALPSRALIARSRRSRSLRSCATMFSMFNQSLLTLDQTEECIRSYISDSGSLLGSLACCSISGAIVAGCGLSMQTSAFCELAWCASIRVLRLRH